jgi:hypothetical protein
MKTTSGVSRIGQSAAMGKPSVTASVPLMPLTLPPARTVCVQPLEITAALACPRKCGRWRIVTLKNRMLCLVAIFSFELHEP